MDSQPNTPNRTFIQVYPDFEPDLVMRYAQQTVQEVEMSNPDLSWSTAVQTVLSVCCTFPNLFPLTNNSPRTLREYVGRWVKKYFDGYNSRASRRISRRIGTLPDNVVDRIISARLPSLDNDRLVAIRQAHRLSMSAENILGLLLEEYLAQRLLDYGWYCCWGETVRSVDFCTQEGDLLQVKNRSNSENSSSSRVRIGTNIKKWHRINAVTGTHYWRELNTLVGSSGLSEEDFSSFVQQVIADNPGAVYVESDNIWAAQDNRQLGLWWSS